MNIEFSSQKPLILDGGMGQTLIRKGMIPQGTLWSATALIDTSLYQMVIEAHQEFMQAGAKVITTNNFTVRKLRFSENKILNKFEEALHTAGNLAQQAKHEKVFKDVIIAGSIPTRNQTYMSNFEFSNQDIHEEINLTGGILDEYVDIFYLDVLSSIKEIELALEGLSNYQKKVLIGVHIKKNGLMPDGNEVGALKSLIDKHKILGVIVACTDQSSVLGVIEQMQKLNIPFGFKVNAFANIPEGWKIKPGNPTESLGVNKDFNEKSFLDFSEKCRSFGASIFGGCCEVRSSHIKALADFYSKN